MATYEVWRTADHGLGLVYRGEFDHEVVMAAMLALAELDTDESATHVVLDTREMVSRELDLESVHRLVTGIRTRFRRGHDVRIVFVATGINAGNLETFRYVRDVASGRDIGSLPVLQIFADIDAAWEWAAVPST